VAQGPPLRHARVTQGSRKGEMEEVALFATKVEKGRAGWARKRAYRDIAVIARHRRDRATSP
jgi:hypothetical protein